MLLQFQGRFENVLLCFLYHVCFYIDLGLTWFGQGLLYQRVWILSSTFFEYLSFLNDFLQLEM